MCCQESTTRSFRGKILSFWDRTQHMDARHIRNGMFYKTYATLSVQSHRVSAIDEDVGDTQADDLGEAGTGVVKHGK